MKGWCADEPSGLCDSIRSSARKLASLFEFLPVQSDGRVEPRSEILEAHDRRQLDQLRLVKVVPNLSDELIVDRWRRVGHGLRVLYDQPFQRIEQSAVTPMRHRLDLLPRN